MSGMIETLSNAPVDWRQLSLAEAGRSLVEASAGTGKTWTMAILYLRLLLERGLSPRQIVVATFSDAAAQELRERLRGKLQWAITQALGEPAEPVELHEHADEQWLHARWQSGADHRTGDLACLRLALAEMDMAPISTLHGLCRRILADHPFACGVTFDMGELIAGGALLDEVAGDLWRRLQQGDDSDELVQLQQAAMLSLTMESLTQRLRDCLAPGVLIDVKVVPEHDQALLQAWAPRLRALTARDELFNKNSVLRRNWNALADFIEHRSSYLEADIIAALHDAGDLKGVPKAGKNDDEMHAAAAFSVEFAGISASLREQATMRFWQGIADAARQQMQSRLQARRQLTFDELLGKVSQALLREPQQRGPRPLADALFAAWPVAMIDEFQDTDGLQYGILDAIYRQQDGTVRGRLLMVGDPKQAIYRFRGGDIHAYQRAAAQADANGRLTLGTNHRSSRALVEAFNQFYEVGGIALSANDDHGITYQPVAAGGRADGNPYTVDGRAPAQPLQIHCLPMSECPETAAERCTLALEVCANQIADILQSGRYRIGDRVVVPSDMAVLLPTGGNISDLRDLLRERGVPCVTSSKISVFDTDTARELQVVLYAVEHNTELGALRAAAATRLWGASFSQMQQWDGEATGWQPVILTIRRWHQNWRERGVQYVVEALIERMAPRYLQTLGGERVLTDLRHLGELLQQQSETLAGAEELLAWLNQCRENDAAAGGELQAGAAQLRIESDSPRVQLMTLHASKGLEFPIVFLPLMWNHGERAGSGIHVVSDPVSGRRTAEVSERARQQEMQDLQDERFRLLYVALTRAVHACHVYALPPDRRRDGRSKEPTQGTARSALDVMLARLPSPLLSDDLAAMTSNIHWVTGWSPMDRRDFIVPDAPDQQRQARAMPASPSGPMEARHSFTTLTRGGHGGAIEPGASAVDESDTAARDLVGDLVPDGVQVPVLIPAMPPQPDAELLALAVVRGVDFGNAVHAILEHREVGAPMSTQLDLIERCLSDAGVRRRDIEQPALINALAQRLQCVLEAPLGLLGDPLRSLASTPVEDLRAEMEFYFPLEQVSMSALRRVCMQHGEPDLVPRSTRSLSGLMNGKIDLIFQCGERFHVVDYKGNYLGDGVADYQGDALLRQMDRGDYRFQALLYTVALDRYLRQRLGAVYERHAHLGECLYLFIRGVGLAPDAGIWRHRFPDALLDAVAGVLAGHDVVGAVA